MPPLTLRTLLLALCPPLRLVEWQALPPGPWPLHWFRLVHLSDGEVCKQFWSGLCHLVPGLHVAGYHHRLLILDMQMEHIQKSKQSGLGEWLHSHLLNAKRHLEDTERGLGKHDVDQLLVHFKAQHHYHTKPLPQQSKNPG